MSRILNEFETGKPALRRYIARFFSRAQDIEDTRIAADTAKRNADVEFNTKLIAQNWDDFLRVAGSLKMGTISGSELIRSLQRGSKKSMLARAIGELGRIPKTLHLLAYIDDETFRRRILTQLNRGEGRHSLARKCFFGQRGELRQHYREGQEDQLGALGQVAVAQQVGRRHHAFKMAIFVVNHGHGDVRSLENPQRVHRVELIGDHLGLLDQPGHLQLAAREQYREPQRVHVYDPSKPQTAQKGRAGAVGLPAAAAT